MLETLETASSTSAPVRGCRVFRWLSCGPRRISLCWTGLGKRIRFLRQVQHELGLDNVTAVQSRVESFMLSAGFDGVISRVFASLGDMLIWCAALPVKEKGRFYALKGQLSEMELTALPSGFRLESVIGLQVHGLEGERHIVVVAAN